MILCDLPYGMTSGAWDSPLPLDKLWIEYERIIKKDGIIVLTSTQPFTTTLINSNPRLFRYELIWQKSHIAGFVHANRKPLKNHENILVFYKKLGVYNPQKWKSTPYDKSKYNNKMKPNRFWKTPGEYHIKSEPNHGERFPLTILKIKQNWKRQDQLHPTQKPVALFEYLIKTYTNPGDTVLDNCAGSGTTGVACHNTNRRCIMIEKEPDYCEIIRQRMGEVTSQTRLKCEVSG